MDLTADHLGFVIGAYAISAIMLAGLVTYILARDRALRCDVRRLEIKRTGTTP